MNVFTKIYTESVLISDIPTEGIEFNSQASSGECKSIASHAGLQELELFQVRGKIIPCERWGRELICITGHMKARFSQECVITLDPFVSDLEDSFEFLLSQFSPLEGDIEQYAEDEEVVIDYLKGNMEINVGNLILEHLVVSINPYPRKPCIPRGSFKYSSVSNDTKPLEESDNNPFAILGELRRKI